ncbi:carbon-nitrogen hydrolase family protein [bacterium]|nr:carbon-nitrogen hydrolase family protein [candidate division CSSED10-310 bacterium]
MESPTISSSAPSLRVAGIQCAFQNSRNETIERVLFFTKMALEKGAELIAFSECFTLPWFHTMDRESFRAMAESLPGPSTQPFIDLSEQTSSTFICPIYEKQGNRHFFSTAVIKAGQIAAVYRKVHLARFGNWNELSLADPGEEIPVIDLGFSRIGILMGWDAFFPEAVQSLALRGCEIIIVPTAAALASKFRWLSVLTSHSVCNNVFVIRINRCGNEGDLEFYGESFCIDPFGVLLDEPTFHRDSLMIADLKLRDIGIARKEFPFLSERRPDIYNTMIEGTQEESSQ